jgi:opine dehydrogenase
MQNPIGVIYSWCLKIDFMNISVIGIGNGGQAMAGHFALLGHRVVLYGRDLSKISIISETKKIHLSEVINGTSHLSLVTNSLRIALRDAELIMVVTTADAHRGLAKEIAPFVKDNQIIVLNPGRTLGALDFSNALYQNTNKRVYIAETQSLIYACRADSPGNVRIIGVKDKVPLAAYPATDTLHVLEALNSVFPCFLPARNILETGLENMGAIFHPSVILFNAAAIERGNIFYFYNDITPAIARFLETIDRERLTIGKSFGFNLKSVTEWVTYAYPGIIGDTLCDKIKNNPAYYKILAPIKLDNRLLTEDLPTGILPLIELGKISGVPTPLMESVLHISQTLLMRNFKEEGRTMKNLFPEESNVDSIIKRLHL